MEIISAYAFKFGSLLHFIAKCDSYYYKMLQLYYYNRQQRFITKLDSYYKMRSLLQNLSVQWIRYGQNLQPVICFFIRFFVRGQNHSFTFNVMSVKLIISKLHSMVIFNSLFLKRCFDFIILCFTCLTKILTCYTTISCNDNNYKPKLYKLKNIF